MIIVYIFIVIEILNLKVDVQVNIFIDIKFVVFSFLDEIKREI